MPGIPDFYQLFKPDKIVHLILYGVLSYLLLQSMLKQYGHASMRYRGTIIALALSILYGALMEYLQYASDLKRSGNIYDFIANTTGSIIGIAVFHRIARKKNGQSKCQLKKT
jgi:VanZ family protein